MINSRLNEGNGSSAYGPSDIDSIQKQINSQRERTEAETQRQAAATGDIERRLTATEQSVRAVGD